MTELLDSDYDIAQNYTYDPFGDSIISTAESIIRDPDMEMQSLIPGAGIMSGGMIINHAPENPYRYCGEYTDIETGYVYLRTRYYDSNLGRFISEDSAKDGYNWYVYCGNDPVNRVDPSGCFTLDLSTLLMATNNIAAATIVKATLSIIITMNYEYNHKLDMEDPRYNSKPIEDQNDDRIIEYMYGWLSMRENGCGVIAIHNVKYLLEMNPTLADTVRSTQKAGGMVLFGVFGTYPWKIDNVLKQDGINCKRIGKDEIYEQGIYILTYHYGKSIFNGVHNVVLKIDDEGKKTIYNDNDPYDDVYWDTRVFMQAYRIVGD